MEGQIIPMRSGDDEPPAAASLPVRGHRLDTAPPVPRRTRWQVLGEAVLLIPNLVMLLSRLLRDRRVPRRRRLLMLAVAGYVISPIDAIPDFIPVLGGIDDVLVLAFAIDYLLAGSPPEVVDEYWDGSEDGLDLIRGIAGWGVELLPARVRRLVAG
jgi:uncharacterized membrane protein YkvA (DUF1232 family)